MKKILLAAMMVAVTTIVNAASISWTLSYIEDSPNTTASAGNMVAYLMNGSTYSELIQYTTVSDVASYVTDNCLSTATLKVSRGNAYVNGTVTDYTGYTVTSVDEYTGTESGYASLYIILFDSSSADTASYYFMTDVEDYTLAAGGAITVNVYYDSYTTGWQSVPEPTSGVLMLLGLAGLGLRRKRV